MFSYLLNMVVLLSHALLFILNVYVIRFSVLCASLDNLFIVRTFLCHSCLDFFSCDTNGRLFSVVL